LRPTSSDTHNNYLHKCTSKVKLYLCDTGTVTGIGDSRTDYAVRDVAN